MNQNNKPLEYISQPLSNKKKFPEWQVGNKYEIIKVLGHGSYGEVAEAIELSTSRKVAIKKISSLFEDEIDCKRILREITILRQLNHPCIVKILDILPVENPKSFDTIYLIMTFAQSDIKKLLKSPMFLTYQQVITICYNLLAGLYYLHSSGIMHRDLKPANILLNDDCSVMICDFGLARLVPDYFEDEKYKNNKVIESSPKRTQKRKLTAHVITRWYRPPEIILCEKDYNESVDIWSYGCIFAEVLNMIKENAPNYSNREPLFPGESCFPLSPEKNTQANKGCFPFQKTDQLAIIISVVGVPEQDCEFLSDDKAVDYIKSFPKRENLNALYPGANNEAIEFLKKTLQFNPYNRIQLADALAHPVFQKVRDRNLEFKASRKVVLPFEYDENLDIKRLRQYFLQEISHYN